MLRRMVGWTLGFFSVLSLLPGLAFIILLMMSGAPLSHVYVRGGVMTVVSGLIVTALMFWGSVRLLRGRPARGPVWR
jgi:hypothetical protein